MDKEAYLAQVSSIVDRHGVCVQAVAAETPFAYTVGVFARDHPEFVVFGLPQRLAHGLLNDLAHAVLRGDLRFSSGDRVHRLIANGFGWLVAVDDPEEYLGVAYEIAGRPVAALQLVLPDRNGAWPWEPWTTESDLPVLGKPPTTDVGRDVELPPADVRRAQGW
jgi:hypothetical protein